MIRSFFIALLSVLFIFPTICKADPIVKKDSKVLLIGDSLAYGLKTPLKKKAKAAEINFVVDARGGTTLHDWYEKGWAKIAIEKQHPSIVLISLGTNDSGYKKKFAIRAKQFVDMIQDMDITVVWILPPKMPFSVEFVWKGVWETEATGILDSRCLDLPREKDRIHPTFKSYNKWADEIWNYLTTDKQTCVKGCGNQN